MHPPLRFSASRHASRPLAALLAAILLASCAAPTSDPPPTQAESSDKLVSLWDRLLQKARWAVVGALAHGVHGLWQLVAPGGQAPPPDLAQPLADLRAWLPDELTEQQKSRFMYGILVIVTGIEASDLSGPKKEQARQQFAEALEQEMAAAIERDRLAEVEQIFRRAVDALRGFPALVKQLQERVTDYLDDLVAGEGGGKPPIFEEKKPTGSCDWFDPKNEKHRELLEKFIDSKIDAGFPGFFYDSIAKQLTLWFSDGYFKIDFVGEPLSKVKWEIKFKNKNQADLLIEYGDVCFVLKSGDIFDASNYPSLIENMKVYLAYLANASVPADRPSPSR